MLFLVYSPLSSSSIEYNLGMADYSYYFVMKRFLPLLREFGEVEILDQAPTDEDIARYQTSGDCVYLSFTPPNKLAPITRCPAVPVFAWEYSTIPDEEFTCAADNWVRTLQNAGTAITHSRYAVDVVRSQLGDDYPIESIPAPIWESYRDIREARKVSPPRGLDGLDLDCTVIDTNDYEISNTAMRPRPGSGGIGKRFFSTPWGQQPLTYDFAGGGHDLTLIGFNDAEPWGLWSRSGYPWVLFGCSIDGEIELGIRVRGYMQNIGKRLRVELGSAAVDLLLSEHLQTHVFRLHIEQPTNVLAFVGVERASGATDPRDIGIGLAEISIRRPAAERVETDSLIIDMSRHDMVGEGLYDAEPQGRWTSASQVTIQLPTSVAGDLHLGMDVFHLLHNHDREIEVCVGEQCRTLTLQDGCSRYELDFTGVVATDYLRLCGLAIGPVELEDESRSLGLGISSISLQRKLPREQLQRPRALLQSLRQLPAQLMQRLRTGGRRSILYTAIFNPKDGRKNWEDIITGFVYAFRDDPGATLLIKITYHQLDQLFEDIFTFIVELHPFKCRLIFIHGYLTDEQYEQLLVHSQFIVNASRGEGQCLPLMEFMSAGVPAVAPDNTAMAEYINASNAFIVASSPDLTFWAHDPRQVFRTLWQRIDWASLVTAFSDSARTYRETPEVYRQMSQAAVDAQEKYCSMNVARSRFRGVLGQLTQATGR